MVLQRRDMITKHQFTLHLIGAGILCNPGAAYRDVGITDEEVATLAGEKEGCNDSVDFIEVQRPAVADTAQQVRRLPCLALRSTMQPLCRRHRSAAPRRR